MYTHIGVRRTPVGSSQYYMSVCLYICLSISLYLCLSVSLSGHPHICLTIIRVACNFLQRMRPQDILSNPLSGSITCPSVHPSVCPFVRDSFRIFVFAINSSVGVQRRNSFIPILGSKVPQWGPVELLCLSLCFYFRYYASLFGDRLYGQ